jgi:hypothetical protein
VPLPVVWIAMVQELLVSPDALALAQKVLEVKPGAQRATVRLPVWGLVAMKAEKQMENLRSNLPAESKIPRRGTKYRTSAKAPPRQRHAGTQPEPAKLPERRGVRNRLPDYSRHENRHQEHASV